jgi:hypothetical protein
MHAFAVVCPNQLLAETHIIDGWRKLSSAFDVDATTAQDTVLAVVSKFALLTF